MTSARLLALGLAAPLALAHGAPSQMPADTSGFVVRHGTDTVLVERVRRTGDSLAVTLVDVRRGGARLTL